LRGLPFVPGRPRGWPSPVTTAMRQLPGRDKYSGPAPEAIDVTACHLRHIPAGPTGTPVLILFGSPVLRGFGVHVEIVVPADASSFPWPRTRCGPVWRVASRSALRPASIGESLPFFCDAWRLVRVVAGATVVRHAERSRGVMLDHVRSRQHLACIWRFEAADSRSRRPAFRWSPATEVRPAGGSSRFARAASSSLAARGSRPTNAAHRIQRGQNVTRRHRHDKPVPTGHKCIVLPRTERREVRGLVD
jgi:hypothetical protein